MLKKGYVDTADGQMHYRRDDSGSGDPIVIFHMTASSSAAYEPLIRALAGKRPAIAFDTPNYGQSFKTTKEPSMAYIASVMLEALGNLGIKKFHLLGHHTGSSVAIEVASIAPDKVLSVTLSGMVYITAEENIAFGKQYVVDIPFTVYGTQNMWAWTRAVKMDPTPITAAILNREMIDTLTAGENWNWAYKAVFSFEAQRKVHELTCPIFLVAGESDDARPLHDRAIAGLPHARVLTAKGYGTYYIETESGAVEFSHHILDFVGSVR
jgi:pimeloyl-ACP methyl ester carboxylesterase